MNDFKQKFKTQLGSNLIIATYSIILFLTLVNIKNIFGVVTGLAATISPFIVAVGVAFVLNLPLKLVEKYILCKTKLTDGAKRAASIVITLATIGLVFYLGVLFIAPQISESVSMLTTSIPGFLADANDFILNFVKNLELTPDIMNQIVMQLNNMVEFVSKIVVLGVPMILDFTIAFANNTINMFLSLIFAIYMLASKERVILGIKKIIYSVFNTKTADKIMKIGNLTNVTFSGFIGGQLTEAVILGCLTTVGLWILQIEYAMLIGLLVGASSVVPIFGAFIGAVPCILILLMTDPKQALIFIIFIIILQQLEGNLIYPKVVGNSIGISGLWIMFAMLLGGQLYGVMGIILGIPTFAVIYILVKEWAENRLEKKNISLEETNESE